MKRTLLIGVIIALIVPSTVGSEETFTVSGFGAYPISENLTSMWLVAPDKRPLVIAYFDGPDGRHNTEWRIASKVRERQTWLGRVAIGQGNSAAHGECGDRGGGSSDRYVQTKRKQYLSRSAHRRACD